MRDFSWLAEAFHWHFGLYLFAHFRVLGAGGVDEAGIIQKRCADGVYTNTFAGDLKGCSLDHHVGTSAGRSIQSCTERTAPRR